MIFSCQLESIQMLLDKLMVGIVYQTLWQAQPAAQNNISPEERCMECILADAAISLMKADALCTNLDSWRQFIERINRSPGRFDGTLRYIINSQLVTSLSFYSLIQIRISFNSEKKSGRQCKAVGEKLVISTKRSFVYACSLLLASKRTSPQMMTSGIDIHIDYQLRHHYQLSRANMKNFKAADTNCF